MKILAKDLKRGLVRINIDSLDDLWFLSHIIDQGDFCKGKTFRKVKLGESDDRNAKIIKKPVIIKINVEKVDFHKYKNSLRVSGKIIEGPVDVPKGSYHTLDIHEGTDITIIKNQWLKYQIDKLEEAAETGHANILIVVMDREEASFALLKKSGYEMLTNLKGVVGKKEYESKATNFYGEIIKIIEQYVERYKTQSIILGSPAFWKEDLMKEFKKSNLQLSKKVTLATCNNIGTSGVEEILKRNEVKSVLQKDRSAKEATLVEEVFSEIAKSGKVAYGVAGVKTASDARAIVKLLVTDDFIHIQREQGTYLEIDQIMKDTDKSKGEVHIISTEYEAGKKLDGLGGIAAILRYKLEY